MFQNVTGTVLSVSRKPTHSLSKDIKKSIQLLKGLGVEKDAHCGVTVKHRSRVRQDPFQPNLRQVHLIQSELFAELQTKGFTVGPADLGENITTKGLDLIALPTDTIVKLGPTALVQLTGFRNPCSQLDDFQQGLMAAVVERDSAGNLIRRAGVMGIVLHSGLVKPGDVIQCDLPDEPFKPLERV